MVARQKYEAVIPLRLLVSEYLDQIKYGQEYSCVTYSYNMSDNNVYIEAWFDNTPKDVEL